MSELTKLIGPEGEVGLEPPALVGLPPGLPPVGLATPEVLLEPGPGTTGALELLGPEGAEVTGQTVTVGTTSVVVLPTGQLVTVAGHLVTT